MKHTQLHLAHSLDEIISHREKRLLSFKEAFQLKQTFQDTEDILPGELDEKVDKTNQELEKKLKNAKNAKERQGAVLALFKDKTVTPTVLGRLNLELLVLDDITPHLNHKDPNIRSRAFGLSSVYSSKLIREETKNMPNATSEMKKYLKLAQKFFTTRPVKTPADFNHSKGSLRDFLQVISQAVVGNVAMEKALTNLVNGLHTAAANNISKGDPTKVTGPQKSWYKFLKEDVPTGLKGLMEKLRQNLQP